MNQNHLGSSLDDFLIEEGILTEANTIAIKRVSDWQVEQIMEPKSLSKKDMKKTLSNQKGVKN